MALMYSGSRHIKVKSFIHEQIQRRVGDALTTWTRNVFTIVDKPMKFYSQNTNRPLGI